MGISFDIQTPLLLVVKKNTTVLKRLNTWLLSQTQEINGEKRITNKSLLIIDDEADNASINTKKPMKHQQQSMDGYEKSPDISIASVMLVTQPPHLPTSLFHLTKMIYSREILL